MRTSVKLCLTAVLVPVQGVRKVGRAVGSTVSQVATLSILERFGRRKEMPRLHLEVTFYQVSAEEMKAVASSASVDEVS